MLPPKLPSGGAKEPLPGGAEKDTTSPTGSICTLLAAPTTGARPMAIAEVNWPMAEACPEVRAPKEEDVATGVPWGRAGGGDANLGGALRGDICTAAESCTVG
mmetsp:Transcript_22144/g.75958  ORF Transcript_22144/g.75958 Transcript_22144/m.75958 type:complete len:103 (+) Transcript_22144:635-943(+)